MTQDIHSGSSVPATIVIPFMPVILDGDESSQASNKAWAASLQKLQEVLEVVANSEAEAGKGGASAKALMGNSGIEAMTTKVRSTLIQNPDDFMSVIAMIAPSVKGSSQQVTDKFIAAQEALLDYHTEIKNLDKKTFEKGMNQVVAPFFANVEKSAVSVEGMFKQIKPTLERLREKDPSKMQGFVNKLSPILSMVAARNPKKAKDVLEGLVANGTLENLYSLDSSSQEKFFSDLKSNLVLLSAKGAPSPETLTSDPVVRKFLGSYSESGTTKSPDLSGSLGLAMMYLQQFQVSLSQAQADQDELTINIGNAMINSSQDLETQLDKKIDQATAEAKAAAHRPWWEKLVMALTVIVSVVVAAVTAGVGAALIAVAVGAFMASPAFNASISSLSKALGGGAVGDFFAKVIVTAAVMVVTCGMAGVTTVGDLAAQEAVEEGVETGVSSAVDAGAEDGADSAVGSSANSATKDSKLTYSLKRVATFGKKMAIVNGIATLCSSNIWMDAMTMIDPTWVKKHQDLAIVIDVLVQLVALYAGYKAGVQAFKSATSDATLLEKLPSQFRALLPMSYIAQIGQGAMELGLSIKRAEYLNDQFETTKVIGQLQAEIGMVTAGNETLSNSRSVNDDSASNITKSVTDEMAALQADSGRIWGETVRQLSS
jgi:CHASE3 domain sensor protein